MFLLDRSPAGTAVLALLLAPRLRASSSRRTQRRRRRRRVPDRARAPLDVEPTVV